MSDILNALHRTLDDFDKRTEPYSELDVWNAIQSLKDDYAVPEPPPLQLLAEAMAFGFLAAYSDETTGWGTYYGPMAVLQAKDGSVLESPSLRLVTREMIEYWINRSQTAVHPILRARYADLVWDFQKMVTGQAPHYSLAQTVVDANVEVAQRQCYAPQVYVIDKLRRALALALGLNDRERVGTVVDAIIAYEDAVAVDSKPGLWGFAFDLLFDNDKVELSDSQRRKLVDDLEARLARAFELDDETAVDQWLVEAAARRLAMHYRKAGSQEDMRRVLNLLADAFLAASSTGTALQAVAWLQQVHSILREYGVGDLEGRVIQEIREAEKRTGPEMKVVSHTVEISTDEIDRYVSEITAGGLADSLVRVAADYIPKRDELETQLRELASAAPLVYLIPSSLQDSSGRQVAQVGPLEEDLEGHTVMQFSKNMGFEALFLRRVFEKLSQLHSGLSQELADHILLSPLFLDERRPMIEAGLGAFLDGDHMEAVHLLVPQIEHAIRVLLELAGGSSLRPDHNGTLTYRLLHDMLRDPLLARVLRDDLAFYLRVLLVDNRGWNLRNRISHGLCEVSEFSPQMSDRIVHVLLCLALVRTGASAGETSEP